MARQLRSRWEGKRTRCRGVTLVGGLWVTQLVVADKQYPFTRAGVLVRRTCHAYPLSRLGADHVEEDRIRAGCRP